MYLSIDSQQLQHAAAAAAPPFLGLHLRGGAAALIDAAPDVVGGGVTQRPPRGRPYRLTAAMMKLPLLHTPDDLTRRPPPLQRTLILPTPAQTQNLPLHTSFVLSTQNLFFVWWNLACIHG